jgi:hypothetical protein
VGLILLMASGVVLADDLKGESSLLCTVIQAARCGLDGECTAGPAWRLNIPQFLEVDVEAKTISTTRASGEDRSTELKTVEREDGLIILQGVENGRAFSMVIVEETGLASIAVALEEKAVMGSAACTPMPGSN